MAVSDRIAVMNRGSIVQVGSAEDLYYRPASEFVARFVGKVNLVPGHVASAGAQGVEVDALGQRIGVREPPPGLRAGDPVNLVLRPEAIRLEAAAGEATGPAPPATITARTFLGEKVEYLVECGGETLQVAQHSAGPNATSLIVGQRVKLHLPGGDVALLAGGGP